MGRRSVPNYTRVLFHDGDAWNVTVPELNDCTTFGDTREAALAAADEMIVGYLEALAKHGEPAPKPFNDPIRVDPAR